MEEKRKWNGLTEDEWTALVVILLAGLLMGIFFTRGCNSADSVLESDATPLVITTEDHDTEVAVVVGERQSTGEILIAGTAPAGAVVSVLLDGDTIGEVTADNNGDWSLSHMIGEAGYYAAYARFTDAEGHSNSSKIANFQVTGPTIVVEDVVEEQETDHAATGDAADEAHATEGDADDAAHASSEGDSAAQEESALTNDVAGATGNSASAPAGGLTLNMPGNLLEFGAVYVNGTAMPDTNIDILLDNQILGSTTTTGDGQWAYTALVGDINYGDHIIQATSGDATTDPLMFTLRPPQSPTFDNNLDGVISAPGQYRVSGRGTPNWKIQYSINNIPFERPTDQNGLWEDVDVQLTQVGCYQFRLAALDANNAVVPGSESGPYDVIITEDGSPTDGVCPQSADDTGGASGAAQGNTGGDAGAGEGAVDGAAAGDGAADGAAADDSAAADDGAADNGATDSTAADGAAADSADGTTDEGADAAAEDSGAAADATGDAATGEDSGGEGADANSAQYATLGEALAADGNFTMLLTAIDAAGLNELLASNEPITIFAPTDAAFNRLPAGALDSYLASPNALVTLLANHVVNGALSSTDVAAVSSSATPFIPTLAGSSLQLTNSESGLAANNALINKPDMVAANGTVHGIDNILLLPFSPAPVIDVQGVPTFEGTFLTIVGTAAPNTELVIAINGVIFGRTQVEANGNWIVSGDIVDGQYEIIAYTYDTDGLLLAASNMVNLTVLNK